MEKDNLGFCRRLIDAESEFIVKIGRIGRNETGKIVSKSNKILFDFEKEKNFDDRSIWFFGRRTTISLRIGEKVRKIFMKNERKIFLQKILFRVEKKNFRFDAKKIFRSTIADENLFGSMRKRFFLFFFSADRTFHVFLRCFRFKFGKFFNEIFDEKNRCVATLFSPRNYFRSKFLDEKRFFQIFRDEQFLGTISRFSIFSDSVKNQRAVRLKRKNTFCSIFNDHFSFLRLFSFDETDVKVCFSINYLKNVIRTKKSTLFSRWIRFNAFNEFQILVDRDNLSLETETKKNGAWSSDSNRYLNVNRREMETTVFRRWIQRQNSFRSVEIPQGRFVLMKIPLGKVSHYVIAYYAYLNDQIDSKKWD